MYDASIRGFEGCVYTIFTPFDAREAVDFDALERYLRGLYAGGARAFYAMAYNSRYSQMTDAEIFELNAFCIRTVKGFPEDCTIVVGDPIHCSTRTSAEFARHAKDCGADLISLIMREKYFADDQVLDHFAEISAASKMPILVHEMPFLSGYDGRQMHWPLSLLEALPRIPEIMALKEDAKDPAIAHAALALEPRIRIVFAGTKASFRPLLAHGARAYLNGISIVDARIGEAFWAAAEAGDDARIDAILSQLEAPFFAGPVAKYGWHRCNKALLEAAGLMSRRERMPLKALDDAAFADIQACWARIAPAIDAAIGA